MNCRASNIETLLQPNGMPQSTYVDTHPCMIICSVAHINSKTRDVSVQKYKERYSMILRHLFFEKFKCIICLYVLQQNAYTIQTV